MHEGNNVYSGLFNLFNKNIEDDIFDNSKLIFHNNYLIVGTEYNCRKKPNMIRSDVIKKTTINTPVHIEQFI